ncbi:hypothetical protein D3227_31930 [Mesorhizobium waimense]|uniref:Uncharacterized protein n=1 Tax=Mesorhizobium waimense TaxID=1300307 RepID=A0A3A5K9V2_9HYPH|nr:hypothetical protein D3227_31930 [Mesorhizobium waimense]
MTHGEAELDHVLDAWVAKEDQRENENREEATRRLQRRLARAGLTGAGDADAERELGFTSVTRSPAKLRAS